MTGYNIAIKSTWLQQDGARTHTSNNVHRFLREDFEERVLSNRYPALFGEGVLWPPISLDLFSVEELNGCGVSEKSAQNVGAEN
jgi:hypothetical protein